MHTKELQQLAGGEMLARSVYQADGTLLLGAGERLEGETLARLVQVTEGEDLTLTLLDRGETGSCDPLPAVLEASVAGTMRACEDALARGLDPAGQALLESALADVRSEARLALPRDPFRQLLPLAGRIAAEGGAAAMPSLPPVALGRTTRSLEHGICVAATAAHLGALVGYPQGPLLRDIILGALLHDIGKTALPVERALYEIEVWTPAELERYRRHPRIGYLVLRSVLSEHPLVADIAYSHHERQDGRGFPRGLAGTNTIRLYDQSPRTLALPHDIVALADYYVHRVVRGGRGGDRRPLITQLRDQAGHRFNAELVGAFERSLVSSGVV